MPDQNSQNKSSSIQKALKNFYPDHELKKKTYSLLSHVLK